MTYRAHTSLGPIRMPVEPFGPVGVQQAIADDPERNRVVDGWYVVVHLQTGHTVCSDRWTLQQARALAHDLAGIHGWDRVPADYDANRPRSREYLRRSVGNGFRDAVKMTIAKHRARRQGVRP